MATLRIEVWINTGVKEDHRNETCSSKWSIVQKEEKLKRRWEYSQSIVERASPSSDLSVDIL